MAFQLVVPYLLTSIDMMRPPPRHVLSPIAVEGLQQPRRQENPLMEGGVLEERGARTAMNCLNCLLVSKVSHALALLAHNHLTGPKDGKSCSQLTVSVSYWRSSLSLSFSKTRCLFGLSDTRYWGNSIWFNEEWRNKTACSNT